MFDSMSIRFKIVAILEEMNLKSNSQKINNHNQNAIYLVIVLGIIAII
jgi:hypothetical protein